MVAFFFFAAENTTCNSVDEFECGNGDCINYSLTCDGRAHCKDKSDEKPSYCCKCCCLIAIVGLCFFVCRLTYCWC